MEPARKLRAPLAGHAQSAKSGTLPVSRANRRCVENGSQASDRLTPTRTVKVLVAGNGAS